MDANCFPSIHVSIERLNTQIESFLGVKGSELGELIRNKIEEKFEVCLTEIDDKIENIIRNYIVKAVENRVKDYFESGPGYSAICEKVDFVLSESFKQLR